MSIKAYVTFLLRSFQNTPLHLVVGLGYGSHKTDKSAVLTGYVIFYSSQKKLPTCCVSIRRIRLLNQSKVSHRQAEVTCCQ